MASCNFVTNKSLISSALDAALDSALNVLALGKGAVEGQDVPKDAGIAIYPSTISPSAPVLSTRKSFNADESDFISLVSDLT